MGFVREHSILKHDMDMDIGIIVNDSSVYSIIKKVFNNMGFKKVREFTIDGGIKEQSYVKNYVKIDIQYYFQDDNDKYMFCYLFYNPSGNRLATEWKTVLKKCPIVHKLRTISINNNRISIPYNAEALLEFKYGDNWRNPDKGWVYWEGPNTYMVSDIGVLKREF